jgi:hypothetical protein
VHENHDREQYFFAPETTARLADVLSRYASPCCLCAPTVGRALADRGRPCAVLDVDERFADVPGFRRWDLYRPQPLEARFDVLLCDPPFFTVKLSQLFRAVRVLLKYDVRAPLLVTYLRRRSKAFLGTFAPFDLRPTGLQMKYVTVQDVEKNAVELYANVSL